MAKKIPDSAIKIFNPGEIADAEFLNTFQVLAYGGVNDLNAIMLFKSGDVELDQGYSPIKPRQIATKEYADGLIQPITNIEGSVLLFTDLPSNGLVVGESYVVADGTDNPEPWLGRSDIIFRWSGTTWVGIGTVETAGSENLIQDGTVSAGLQLLENYNLVIANAEKTQHQSSSPTDTSFAEDVVINKTLLVTDHLALGNDILMDLGNSITHPGLIHLSQDVITAVNANSTTIDTKISKGGDTVSGNYEFLGNVIIHNLKTVLKLESTDPIVDLILNGFPKAGLAFVEDGELTYQVVFDNSDKKLKFGVENAEVEIALVTALVEKMTNMPILDSTGAVKGIAKSMQIVGATITQLANDVVKLTITGGGGASTADLITFTDPKATEIGANVQLAILNQDEKIKANAAGQLSVPLFPTTTDGTPGTNGVLSRTVPSVETLINVLPPVGSDILSKEFMYTFLGKGNIPINSPLPDTWLCEIVNTAKDYRIRVEAYFQSKYDDTGTLIVPTPAEVKITGYTSDYYSADNTDQIVFINNITTIVAFDVNPGDELYYRPYFESTGGPAGAGELNLVLGRSGKLTIIALQNKNAASLDPSSIVGIINGTPFSLEETNQAQFDLNSFIGSSVIETTETTGVYLLDIDIKRKKLINFIQGLTATVHFTDSVATGDILLEGFKIRLNTSVLTYVQVEDIRNQMGTIRLVDFAGTLEWAFIGNAPSFNGKHNATRVVLEGVEPEVSTVTLGGYESKAILYPLIPLTQTIEIIDIDVTNVDDVTFPVTDPRNINIYLYCEGVLWTENTHYTLTDSNAPIANKDVIGLLGFTFTDDDIGSKLKIMKGGKL